MPLPSPQLVAVIWLTFSAIFLLRTVPATASTDDDDATAQAMLQPLNSMLNWGVANSNPEELSRIAKMVPAAAFSLLLLLCNLCCSQVQEGAAPMSNFDASAMSALFPTPMLDMRGLNSRACNLSSSLGERLQALEVHVARCDVASPPLL